MHVERGGDGLDLPRAVEPARSVSVSRSRGPSGRSASGARPAVGEVARRARGSAASSRAGRWSSATSRPRAGQPAGRREPVRRGGAARARGRAGPGDGLAERDAALADRRLDAPPAPGRVGVGHEHDGDAVRLRADGALAEPPGDARGERVEQRLAGRAAVARRRDERRDAPGERPAGRRGGRAADGLLAGRRLLHEQAHEPPPARARSRPRRPTAPPRSPRRTRPRARRCRRRWPRRAHRARPAAGRRRTPGRDEAAPGDPRADAVGGEQGLEAAAGVELAAAEVHVRLARAAGVRLRRGEQVDEAVEGAPRRRRRTTWPNSPSIAPRVVRHLCGDGGDRLVGEAGEDGAQHLGGLGRHGVVRAGR